MMAKKGLSSETQIDLHERTVRIVRRNHGDESVTLESVNFDNIESVFIKRAQGSILIFNLCILPRASRTPLVIAIGSRHELEDLRDRIFGDLRPQGSATRRAAREAAETIRRRERRPTRTAFAAHKISQL